MGCLPARGGMGTDSDPIRQSILQEEFAVAKPMADKAARQADGGSYREDRRQ